MRKETTWLAALAIVAVATLEGIALASGVNGAAFGVAIAVIAGLAGYKIKPPTRK